MQESFSFFEGQGSDSELKEVKGHTSWCYGAVGPSGPWSWTLAW